MADDLDTLRRRMEAGRRKARQPERRLDYKGARGRLNLRVRDALLDDLELVKLAGGGDKNSFCEALLLEGVRRKLQELRESHDETTWAVLRERIRAERGGGSRT